MTAYLLINKTTKLVENVISVDPSRDWVCPDTHYILEQSKTQSVVWAFDEVAQDYVAKDVVGQANIGATIDIQGKVLNKKPLVTKGEAVQNGGPSVIV